MDKDWPADRVQRFIETFPAPFLRKHVRRISLHIRTWSYTVSSEPDKIAEVNAGAERQRQICALIRPAELDVTLSIHCSTPNVAGTASIADQAHEARRRVEEAYRLMDARLTELFNASPSSRIALTIAVDTWGIGEPEPV